MKKKSPFAKAVAKQLATPEGRAAALAYMAQVDPAAARRVAEAAQQATKTKGAK